MQPSDEHLWLAVENLDVAGVEAALANGADPNARSAGNSLFEACINAVLYWQTGEDSRAVAIFRLLLEAGADPDQSLYEDETVTALCSAARSWQVGIATELLAAGALPNFVCDGETALEIAEFDHFYQTTTNLAPEDRYRIYSKDELPPIDQRGNGSDEWAVWGHQQMIPLLRQHGAHRRYELEPKPVSEWLSLDADLLGGIATRDGVVDESVLQQLSVDFRRQLAEWCAGYVNPWVVGFDADSVESFDYDAHARAGLELVQRLVAELRPAVPVYFRALARSSLNHDSHRQDIVKWAPNQPEFFKVAE